MAGGGADARARVPRRLPSFANLQEALLENIIQNILVEASRGEVVLTSRPRVIALPPLSFPRWGRPGRRPRDGAGGPRGGQKPAGLAQSLIFTPTRSFLSSRIPTPDLLPAASLGPQQIEVASGLVVPPPTDSSPYPEASPSDIPP